MSRPRLSTSPRRREVSECFVLRDELWNSSPNSLPFDLLSSFEQVFKHIPPLPMISFSASSRALGHR
jgi:hypothetical protein